MKKKKQRSHLWDVAKKMPPLRHSIPGRPFQLKDSEVCRWLMKQPDIMNIVFESVKNHGDIVYDSATGTWKGCEYGS